MLKALKWGVRLRRQIFQFFVSIHILKWGLMLTTRESELTAVDKAS